MKVHKQSKGNRPSKFPKLDMPKATRLGRRLKAVLKKRGVYDGVLDAARFSHMLNGVMSVLTETSPVVAHASLNYMQGVEPPPEVIDQAIARLVTSRHRLEKGLPVPRNSHFPRKPGWMPMRFSALKVGPAGQIEGTATCFWGAYYGVSLTFSMSRESSLWFTRLRSQLRAHDRRLASLNGVRFWAYVDATSDPTIRRGFVPRQFLKFNRDTISTQHAALCRPPIQNQGPASC